jgi:CBS domain containing-hemolysin-like protein
MGSVIFIFIVFAAVVLSGLFSGAETGMYQLSRVRLRLGVERKQGLSRLLAHTLRDPAGILVATLIGNNLCVHAVTSTITMMLLDQAGTSHAAEWIATGIATPILFVFAELVPKNIFLFRSDVLLPVVSPLLYVTHQALRWCGAVALLQSLSSVFARLTGTPKPSKVAAESMRRHEIAAILHETQEEGFLTGVQTGMMNRLVIASTTPVKAVMTRLKEVEKVDVQCNREALLQMLKGHEFTRVLAYDGSQDHILGFVNVYQTLGSHASFDTLHDHLKQIRTVDAETFVTDAIDFMQQGKLRILLVTQTLPKKPARPIGIVTMKDLAEELLGELAVW